MMAYIDRMVQYEGDEMDIEVPRVNLNEEPIVLVTHDESTFYANDGAPMVWMEGRKRHLKPKTNGLSLMISGFMCPCHGFMEHNGVKSYVEFAAGKNRDGWFTNDDLINQLEECFDMIAELHPGMKLLFAFDIFKTPQHVLIGLRFQLFVFTEHDTAWENGVEQRSVHTS